MKQLFVRIINGCLCLSLLCSAPIASAQLTKEQLKDRKEQLKQQKKELNEKASKTARKQAKQYAKEGWKTSPGALPLEKQLDRSYLMQMEYDEYGYPKYMQAEAQSIGENYDAAKFQALELAKLGIAGQIETNVTSLIQNQVDNQQLEAEEAASITKSLGAGKSLISKELGRVITVVEAYRTLPNKNKEVLVRIAYNSEMAERVAKKAIRQKLEEDGKKLNEELDKIFDKKFGL